MNPNGPNSAAASRLEKPSGLRLVRAALLTLGLVATSFAPAVAQNGMDVLPADTQSAAGTLPLDQLPVWSQYRPRFSIVHRAGDGVGFQNSYTSLEAFAPLSESPDNGLLFGDNGLLFADVHALFDDDGALGANIGIGRRIVVDDRGSVLGGHVYFDHRDLGLNRFQQISPGCSLVRDNWEVHANGYLTNVFDERQSVPNQFRGRSLFVERFESAMSGADVEVGVPLPVLDQFQPKLFAGWYGFRADGRDNVHGIKARLEASVSDRLKLGVSTQHDKLFGTTASFNLVFQFSASAPLQRPTRQGLLRAFTDLPTRTNERQRLIAPVSRFNNVVVDRSEETRALDPTTGMPFVICHVAPGGSGTGTFSSPFGTVTDAVDDPLHLAGGVDVIYVRGSGTDFLALSGGPATLVKGTALLSDGPVQLLATQVGPQMLPFSGADTGLLDLPELRSQVNLADDTTVDGFFATAPAGDIDAVLISGVGVSDVVISENVLQFPRDGHGVELVSATGSATIIDNQIKGPGKNAGLSATSFDGSAILIGPGSSLGGTIANNVIQESGGDAIAINRALFSGTISDNELSSSRNGIHVVHNDSSSLALTGDITGNRIALNCENGILFENSSNVGVDIADNVIDRNDLSGIRFNTSTFDGTIDDNVINGIFQGNPPTAAELSRIFRIESSGGIPTLTIDLTEATSIESGIRVFKSTIKAGITDNEIDNFQFAGISLDEFEGSSFEGSIEDNVIRDNTIFGILGEHGSGGFKFKGDIKNNTVTGSSAGGIVLRPETFEGDVEGNTITGNGTGLTIYNLGFVRTIVGNIRSNNTSDNTNGPGMLLVGGSLKGDIENNTSSNNGNPADASDPFNGHHGIITFINDIEGDIRGNTTNNNLDHGIQMLGSATISKFVGNIENNIANENGVAGIGVNIGVFTGDITGNTTNGNSTTTLGGALFTGVGVLLDTLTGDVTSNIANDNKTLGISLSRLTWDGEFSGNEIRRSGAVGLLIDDVNSTLGGTTNLSVKNNILSDNNPGLSFLTGPVKIESEGGILNLELTSNTSTPTVGGGNFNYDLINTSGIFNVSPVGVNGVNTGTVGSRDGSVTIP